jgi:hypothetical protein
MKRRDDGDVVRAFKRLTTAADEFVDRAPRVKRIQAERTAILDAITHAELVLSVHRLPKDKEQEQESAIRSKLEEQMRPIRIELEKLQSKAQKAKALLDTALATPALLERRKAA